MTVSLYQQWLNAKQIEAAAVKTRRDIEDQLVKQFSIPENLEGTKNLEAESFKIKIEGRINRKVNADKLQELAAEHGLTEHLSSLFRWKPEINLTAWKATSPEITAVLADAVTVTASRPSFSITLEN